MTEVDNPTKFASKYKLESSRLQNFDYSTPGVYFITISTLNKNNFFGKIINNQMDLSKMGIITQRCLIDIPNHFKNVFIDEFVVMPNHVHFLIKKDITGMNFNYHDFMQSNLKLETIDLYYINCNNYKINL